MMMSWRDSLRKARKAVSLLQTPRYRRALRHGVAATIEHLSALADRQIKTVIDIGAHKGQFSLLALEIFPTAKIYAFEPQTKPREYFQRILVSEERLRLFPTAIGPKKTSMEINISARDDSSSLLPISQRQNRLFPGTAAIGSETVGVAPLDAFLSADEITSPALLKIDVQGYELEVLEGCQSLLASIDMIYVECSYVELYAGQALAPQVFAWLTGRGYSLIGDYNISVDHDGTAIQGDFLFQR